MYTISITSNPVNTNHVWVSCVYTIILIHLCNTQCSTTSCFHLYTHVLILAERVHLSLMAYFVDPPKKCVLHLSIILNTLSHHIKIMTTISLHVRHWRFPYPWHSYLFLTDIICACIQNKITTFSMFMTKLSLYYWHSIFMAVQTHHIPSYYSRGSTSYVFHIPDCCVVAPILLGSCDG